MVRIFDTTLRDGEQAPGFSMNTVEKLQLARRLESLGVDVIEAGFPIASQGDFEAVREVAREIKHSTVAGLARAKREDIDATLGALERAALPRVHVFLATSDLPAGVANLISGRKDELVPHLARHMDVNAIADAGGNKALSKSIAEDAAVNVKRIKRYAVADYFAEDAQGLDSIEAFTETKTTWHPIGV